MPKMFELYIYSLKMKSYVLYKNDIDEKKKIVKLLIGLTVLSIEKYLLAKLEYKYFITNFAT